MSVPATEPTTTPPAPATGVPAAKPEPPKTPEFNFPTDTPLADMDATQQSEYWREKAQKHEKLWKASTVDPKDLSALREKATRFDALEESQKTELQKAADRATAAEAKFAEMESRTLRAEVAAAKGIPAALLSGTTQEELEASADALLAFRGEKPKPDFGGGDRGGDVKTGAQLTKADVSKLYEEKRYDEIEQARKDGRIAMGPPQ